MKRSSFEAVASLQSGKRHGEILSRGSFCPLFTAPMFIAHLLKELVVHLPK
jgi:hypothetical protein